MGRNLIRGGLEGITISVYTPVWDVPAGTKWNEIHNIAHSKKLIGELERVVDIPKLFIQFNIFLYKNMKFKISKYFKISQMQRRQERYQYSKRERERERVTS